MQVCTCRYIHTQIYISRIMHTRNEQQEMISDSFIYDEGNGERMHVGKNASIHPTHLVIQNKGGWREGEREQERDSKRGMVR